VICAPDLYLVCRAILSLIDKGEMLADGKTTQILKLILNTEKKNGAGKNGCPHLFAYLLPNNRWLWGC